MLTGKRVLVTGSSQGIGLAVAAEFLKQGASVALTAEHAAGKVPAVDQLLRKYPGKAFYFAADLSVDYAAYQLVGQVWPALGGIDVLVNNLGTFREPAFLNLTRKHFDFIFGLNVWTAVELTQAVVRKAMTEKRGGRILFSSSLNATRSEPSHTLYDASKGAIDSLTRQLAIELAPHGFTTAAVAPGLVETPLTDFGLQSQPGERRQIMKQIPLKKIATVEDVAGWYAFLASDAACYATGVVIPVDGGLNAQQMAHRSVTEAETRPATLP